MPERNGRKKPAAPREKKTPRVKLWMQLQGDIRDYISKHRLKPGDALPPEANLAALFSVSRTTIRAAIKAMEGQGVLETRPGDGLYLKSLSIDQILEKIKLSIVPGLNELTDLFEIRFHLEYGMAESAINAITAEQVEKLQKSAWF